MTTSPPPVCILAGGLGTRLGGIVQDLPKPLLTVAGEPFLVHQLRLLHRHGIRRAVLCVGYLGEKIERVIGGHCCGVEVRYSYDGPVPVGTLGAIRGARALLDDAFLVLYGDTYLRIDYAAVAETWRAADIPAMMTVLHNAGRWDASNVAFDGERVTVYDKHRPTAEMQWIDYGLGGLRQAALDAVGDDVANLADLYHVLARDGQLMGISATERFYEIGTPEALAEADAFLRSQSP